MNDFEKRVLELKEIFLQGLERRFLEMERSLNLLRENAADTEALESLCTQLHKLAGAAGPYGFLEASEIALAADEICTDLLEQGKAPTSAHLDELSRTVAKLRKAFPVGK